MGVMDRYNEKKRKEQEAAAAGGLAPIGVAERYARKQNPQPVGGVETPPITVSKRSSIGAPDNYDVNIGKSGWQKYLADQERKRTDALAAEEEKTWWEKLGGYLGEVQDTTMSMGTMPSIVESYREDTSYLQPNEDWLEDEQYVFGFLYDTMGHAAAAQYADKLNAAINEEKKAAQIQRVQDAATESGWKGAAHTAGAILTAPLGLADYLDDLAQAAGRGEIREHGTITPFEYSQAVTGGIANELNDVDQFGVAHKVLPEKIPVIGGKGWGDVYGLGTSIAQSALATFAGGSGQALVQFFGSAAASGVDDAINRGATAEQAVAYGTLSGIAEGLAEQIGAEKLLNIGASSTMRELVMNLVKQGVAEGLEEGATTLMNNFADQLVLRDKSNFYLVVEEYMANGYFEGDAKKLAWLDMANDLAYDVLAGFVSGAVHAGPQTAVQTLRENAQAKQIYGEDPGALVGEALEIDPENAYAQKMQGRLDEGKRLTGGQMSRMARENETAMRAQDVSAIRAAAANRLTELGETENVPVISAALAKQAAGEELSRAERQAIAKSRYGRRVANELNADNVRSGEYSAEWAQQIGTKRINAEEYSRMLDAAQTAQETANVEEPRVGTEERNEPQAAQAPAVKAPAHASADQRETALPAAEELRAVPAVDNAERQETGAAAAKDQRETPVVAREVQREAAAVTEESPAAQEEIPVRLEDAAKKYGAQAGAMVHTYNVGGGKQDVAQYDAAYERAYDMGRSGVSLSYAMQSPATSYLTEKQRELAYEAGTAAANTAAATLQAENAAAANGKTGRRVGHVKGQGVTIGDLKKTFNDTQNTAYKLLSTYAEATGIDIVLYKSEPDAAGNLPSEQGRFSSREPGTIYIDINAGLANVKSVDDLAKYAMVRTFAHEFSHFIENWNPVQYNELRKVVFDTLAQRGEDVEFLIEQKQQGGLGYEEASREVVAEALTDVLPDANFVETLANKHKTVFDKLIAKLKEFVAQLRAYYKSIGSNLSREANALKEQVGDAVRYVENIVQLFDNVAVQAVENYQKTVATETKSPADILAGKPITRTGDTLTVGDGSKATHEVEITVTDEEYEAIQRAVPESTEEDVAKKYGLTEDEAAALVSYKSGGSYALNGKLTEKKELDEYQTWMRDNLDTGIEKLPAVVGTVYRHYDFDDFGGRDALIDFLAKFRKDKSINLGGYLSASTVPNEDRTDGKYTVDMVIESQTARSLDGFGRNTENEVLFSRTVKLIPVRVERTAGYKVKMIMREATNNAERAADDPEADEVQHLRKGAQDGTDLRGVPERNPEEVREAAGRREERNADVPGLRAGEEPGPVGGSGVAENHGGDQVGASAGQGVTDATHDDVYERLKNPLHGLNRFVTGGYEFEVRLTPGAGYTGSIRQHSDAYVTNARGLSYTSGVYQNRSDAVQDIVDVARNNRLLDAVKNKEVQNGTTENGADTSAVHEPLRGSEGPARLLEGVEPEPVRRSDEGRKPVRSGGDQGTGDAGRDRRADAEGTVSERGTRDRVGGDLQQLPAVTEESGTMNTHAAAKEYAAEKGYRIEINKLAAKKQIVQVDIYDKQNLPTFGPIIINEASDWSEVKAAIDKREEADAAAHISDPAKLHEIVVDLTAQRSTENPKGSNFVIGESLNLPNGTKARTRANIDAIKLVKKIAAEGRIATPQEQEILSKYVGWGGLADAFGKPVSNRETRRLEYEPVKGLEAEFEELKAVLTEEEYKSARESTKNAHYTSIEVIKAMYDGLKQLGFAGGRMLEPSSGVGNFVGAMPADMTALVKSWTMVELDSITGLFAKHLYPNADVRVQGFEETNIPDGYMDVAIGNVPFGNYAITDKHYPKAVTGAIHNYFFAKALDKVRTGGIVMFITSSYTMNARDGAVRKYIMQRADLLGAIRLPNTAFAGNAGTEVVTDILILKKRTDRTEYAGEAFENSSWERIGAVGYDGAYVNEYFVDHPEMVLGTPRMKRGMYSANELTYEPFADRGSLGDQIREAVKNIQGKMDYPVALSAERENYRQASAKKKSQKLQVKDGVIHAKDENGNLTRVDVDKDTAARITGMVAIRDAHVALCDALQQGVIKKEAAALRKALNKAYDAFVGKYGYLNSPKNREAINAFADRYAILSLENCTTEGKKLVATKSDIFTKDTIAPNRTASSAENVEEGLTISLNSVGRVDVDMIARLTGNKAESVTRQLIDQRLVFKDKNGNLIPAAQYLSGNVRAKLREMEGLVGIDGDYRNNVEALREVVPTTVQHTDIYVNPGANWVPVSVYEDFVGYILKRYNHESYRTGKKDFSVEYVPETNEYKVLINDAYAKNSAQNTQIWGESGKSFSTIFENMLNGRRTNVYKDAGDGTRVLDRVKTEAVAEKAERLSEEFRKWLWEDESRRTEMQELYNETYNALVTPKYSGASLTVNGLNSTYELRPHQKDAVARIINSGGNTLLAHRVGAGKTLEMAAAAMKLKQLGVIKKPMFVVPNNVVAQWGKEFMDYFPAANILVVGDNDMTAAERMTTINRIKNNDYDAVILAYTKFEKIPMTAEWCQRFYAEQIDSVMFAINAEKEAQGGKGFSVKQLETKRKQLEKKLKELTDKAKDEDGAMFEDLGVDSIFVDEAHNFKNLEYSTRMNNVSGLGDSDGVKRSFDLYTKVRYLQQLNGGRGVVFATATPVMNSMTEMYIMQKYLQPDALKQLGIEHFDAWAKMFGEVVNALEIKPSGSGYRLKQTFSRFKNVKALQQLFRSFTDVLTDVPGLKIPKMKGRKVRIVECEQSEFQKNYMAELAERAENVKNVDPSEDNMLKITSDGRKISYSQRMIDPSLPYEENGKIYKCCDNVWAVYQESNKTDGTQMIFCDMATPKGKSKTKTEAESNDEFASADAESAQLYDDIKSRLVQLGIPAKEIAFIHDAKNDKQKAALAEKMNSGTIRVLIGSTGKMGVGLNAQKKAVAIHHLDAPWRPGDIEQRDGRVFRQKNENDEAYKFVYVTKGSFDSRLWDILERKQKFINQVMNGEDVGNEIEDAGEVTLSAAEVKAVASDNPLIMEQVALEKEISKLQSLQQAHRAGVNRAQAKMTTDRKQIANLENLLSGIRADIDSRKDTYSSDKVFSIRIGKQTFTDKKDAGAALVAAAQARAKEGEYTDIGAFAGFTLRVVNTKEGVKGMIAGAGNYEFKTYPLNPTFGITHLISIVEGFEEKAKVWGNTLSEVKGDLETQMQLVAEPFEHAEKLKEKRTRYNEVMYLLNPPTDQQFSEDAEDKEQHQSRTDTLTDRDVLAIAAHEVNVADLTDGERDALNVFRGRLAKLQSLQEERLEQGRLYKEQQFGANVDRAAAAETLNRMHVLDAQIRKAGDEVLDVESKAVLRRVLQKARKVVEQKERERGQEILNRWRDRRNQAEAIKKYRERIRKDVDEMKGWVLRPDNKDLIKHVPDALKEAVVPFLSSIDFTSKQQLRGGSATKADQLFMQQLRKLEAVMASTVDVDDMYSGYTDLPPNFMDRLHDFIRDAQSIAESSSGELIINQMTAAELKKLSDLVRALKVHIKNFNRFHVNAMFRHVYEAGDNSIEFLSQLKPAKNTGAVSEFVLWQQMRPAYAFERFGEGGKAIYDGLRRGQATLAFHTKEIRAFAEKAYTTAEVKSWDKTVKTIKLASGETVHMRVSQIMSLYELSKRKQALGHILGEGIRVSTFTDGRKKISDNGHMLTEEDLKTIIDTLTPRQVEVADKLQQYMQRQGGEWGNHVSVARFGERQFGEENYFPINSDGRHLQANADEKPGNASLYALLNMGFTKQLQEEAKNRIVVYSIFDVFANHMASMAQYNAFALPVVDALKWFNYKQVQVDDDGNKTVLDSVREQMDRAYGVPEETRPGSGRRGYAQSFMINIIKAFNGTEAQGAPLDSWGLQTLHRYNRAQVAYNFRVVVQQPLAISRAATVVDYASIIRGMKLAPAAIRKNIEEMQKYSGIAAWKSLGFYDVNISRGLTSLIKHDDAALDKITDVGMWAAEKADQMTWAAMWSACKEEVIRKQKLKPKDEGFYEAVTKLFEDVIYKTQVVDSVLTKNEFMRDKGFWARAVGSFMSEPTTTASMLLDAFDKYQLDLQRGMTRQQAWKKNGKMIGRLAYVYALGAVMLAAVQAVADALRDDDDYQTFMEKWLEAFGGNAVDELMPLNKLPIISDFYEVLKEVIATWTGWDIYGNAPQSVFMQWYDSLIKGMEIVHDKVSGEDTNYTWYGGAYKLLQAVSGMTGLPMAAAAREIISAWNGTVGAMAPSLKVKTYEPSEKSQIRYAYEDGYLTAEEATEQLLAQGLVDSEDEAYWTIQGWDAGEGYSRYDAICDAVRNGGSITEPMRELTSHGYTEKEVMSQVKSRIGKWYKGGEISKQQAVQMLTRYFDMDGEEITATVNKWSSKVVTGIEYDDIGEEYLAGNITAQRAKQMYKLYGGLDEEKIAEKLAVLDFRKKHPGYDDITYAAVDSYQTYCERAGVPLGTFYDAWKYNSETDADVDANGKSISGSKKAKVLKYINRLNVSSRQKDSLYYAFGWAESKIYEAPWH